VAFAALGDIYVMPVGGRPVNVTNDAALDTDPAWSPDGRQLVYSSDKDSPHLQLWIRDMSTGDARQVTHLDTQPQGATFSPDGKQIAFFDVNGMWRVANLSVLDVATGRVARIHDTLPQPGTPTWSPDGKHVALAEVAPLTRRFREGTNQILTITIPDSGPERPVQQQQPADKWFAPMPMLSIDSRGGCGPVWSPDGTKMAAIYEGVLHVWPVAPSGEPIGPARRVSNDSAHAPSWQGDSRHILYQSLDTLRLVDIESGETRTVPVNLQWTPAIPVAKLVIHAGTLVDMKSSTPRFNVDITISGNKIVTVLPHAQNLHANARVIDATELTVLPGLTEFHSHLQPDYGEAQGRAFLAFGITSVRSPGNIPYEFVEAREANEAGVLTGPRVFGTGYLMEWQRVYYKMGIAISSVAQLELELQRGKVLQYDFFKSYVRLPDLQQKRTVEFAHSIGVPVATHEIYPAAFVGADNTEHTAATSRRGYSPKIATLQRAYDDVVQLFGKSQRYLTPTMSGVGTAELFMRDPDLKSDPRFALYPQWMRNEVARQPVVTAPGGGGDPRGGTGRMVIDIMHAGGIIVAGTDTPNAINLHGELMSYVLAGMTPYEALKTATVNPARALTVDTGTIEAGKLADIVMVEGNPLSDITALHHVKHVVANGRVFEMSDLLNPR